MIKLTFIGYGNMAAAIAQGLNPSLYQITLASPSLQQGIHASGAIIEPDNARAVAQADLVILAVKPDKMPEVLAQIKTSLSPETLLISVAAGRKLDWLLAQCPAKQPIVRAMPNIALSQGLGATPLIANAYVSSEQKNAAQDIFQANGVIAWVSDEAAINTFTALSGSGPAYVFLFMEAMISAARKLGLDQDIAKLFTLQTIAGAHAMAKNGLTDLDVLRQRVTSPGGTTEAALNVLRDGGFEQLINDAMNAAVERANVLAAK